MSLSVVNKNLSATTATQVLGPLNAGTYNVYGFSTNSSSVWNAIGVGVDNTVGTSGVSAIDLGNNIKIHSDGSAELWMYNFDTSAHTVNLLVNYNED